MKSVNLPRKKKHSKWVLSYNLSIKLLKFMIKKVQGDILLSKADAIAHGVAPLDHFDSGLAAHVREDYPSLYKDFRHYCQTYHPKPGSVWLWQGINHKKIFNLMTQEPAEHNSGHPGKASLHNLRHCLKELVHQVEQNNIQSIALPKIATGVGGLDWKDVEPIIEEHFAQSKIPVYVYDKYVKGQAAE
jgi:O-acetyl-ADP-ribose deacetylase (regulator of RNase III)